jgi:hypothetical protein
MGEARNRGTREERIAKAKPKLPKGMKQVSLVIMNSMTGSDKPEDWTPVKVEDVPDWVKHPDTMGALVAGQMCTHATEKTGWFRAEKVH